MPDRSMTDAERLYSSTNSSLPPFGPRVRNSLITMSPGFTADTVRRIDAAELRPCASAIVTGSVKAPGAVPDGTVTMPENTRSPAVRSPFAPSSASACAAAPPMTVESAVTVIPVLGGTVPGVTATVSSVAPPAKVVAGAAPPTPVGGVGTPGVMHGEARFCGAPGAMSAKSLALSSVSWPLPAAPPGFRS